MASCAPTARGHGRSSSGAASASRINTPAPASAQVILPSQGCASTAPASSSGARIYRVRPASVKNVMPNRNSGICTATSRASQPSRCTGMQTASVSAQVSHGLLRSPRCKSGNSRYKNRMLPRNHSPTQAKSVPTQPAATAKLSRPRSVSTSVTVLAPPKLPGCATNR